MLRRELLLRWLRLAFGIAATLLVTTALYRWYRDFALTELGRMTLLQGSLTRERTLATWFSSVLLLAAAASFGLCFLVDRTRRWRAGWLVLAAGFVALSLDEIGSLHERLGDAPQLALTDGLSSGPVAVLGIPFALAAVAMLGFAWARLRREPLVAALLTLGVLCFASVVVQEELEMRSQEVRHAAAGGPVRRAWHLAVIEEGSELAGMLAFIVAGLAYAHRQSQPNGRRRLIGDIDVVVTSEGIHRSARWTVAALGAGLLLSAAAVRALPPAPDWYGDPVPWFAGVAGLLTAAAVWRAAPRASDGWGLAPGEALALASLFWATDQGAGYLITSADVWVGSPNAQLAARALVAGGSVVTAVRYVTAAPALPARGPVLAWGALTAAAALAPSPLLISLLALAAHSQLLVALAKRSADAP